MNKQMICPVCLMNATNNEISAEHMSICYLFCSEQCRENFLARPLLYVGRHAGKEDRQKNP